MTGPLAGIRVLEMANFVSGLKTLPVRYQMA